MVNIEYLRGERESTVITSGGLVTWIPPVKMTSACKIDKEKTDQANCELKFGSWTYNGFKVNIEMVREWNMIDSFSRSRHSFPFYPAILNLWVHFILSIPPMTVV